MYSVRTVCPRCCAINTVEKHSSEIPANTSIKCFKCKKSYLWNECVESEITHIPDMIGAALGASGNISKQQKKRSAQLMELFNDATALERKLAAMQLSPFQMEDFYASRQNPTEESLILENAGTAVVNLQSMLYNLHTLAVIAETNMVLRPMSVDSGTSTKT